MKIGDKLKGSIRFSDRSGPFFRVEGTVAEITKDEVRIEMGPCDWADITNGTTCWLDRQLVEDFFSGALEKREDEAVMKLLDASASI